MSPSIYGWFHILNTIHPCFISVLYCTHIKLSNYQNVFYFNSKQNFLGPQNNCRSFKRGIFIKLVFSMTIFKRLLLTDTMSKHQWWRIHPSFRKVSNIGQGLVSEVKNDHDFVPTFGRVSTKYLPFILLL